MNNSYDRLLDLVTEIARGPKHGGNSNADENYWNQKKAKAEEEAANSKPEEPKKKTILGRIKGAFQGLIANRDARNAKRIQTKLDAANAKFDAEN